MNKFLVLLFVCAIYFSVPVRSQSLPSWKITDLQEYINNADSVLVINFWATFCKPCIRELPFMQSVSEKLKHKRVQMLLVSLDLPEAYPVVIDSFAKANNCSAPIVWLNETNADYFCPKVDKSWSGGIPATLFINRKKGYRKLVEEEMDQERFEEELRKSL